MTCRLVRMWKHHISEICTICQICAICKICQICLICNICQICPICSICQICNIYQIWTIYIPAGHKGAHPRKLASDDKHHLRTQCLPCAVSLHPNPPESFLNNHASICAILQNHSHIQSWAVCWVHCCKMESNPLESSFLVLTALPPSSWEATL